MTLWRARESKYREMSKCWTGKRYANTLWYVRVGIEYVPVSMNFSFIILLLNNNTIVDGATIVH